MSAVSTRRHPPAQSGAWEAEDVRVLAPEILAGKRAIVTGAGTGIGRGVTQRLVELGAHVLGIGRREEKLAATAEAMEQLPGTFEWASVDVRDAEAAREIVRTFAQPGLDLLVNNAGGQFYAPLENISDNGFRSVVDLNLNAVFTLTSAARQGLSQRGGSIVNISLTGVDRGGAGMGHSLAARAGVLALTRTIALEWAHLGIRANCLGPGAVFTEEVPAEATEHMRDQIVPEAVPVGRGTPVEDIAETIAFLTTPAGRTITGQLLQVDGGAHIGAGLHMLPDWPPTQEDS